MKFFDDFNSLIASHPDMLAQLETALHFKFWILLALAIYFLLLPYRDYKKQQHTLAEHAAKHNGKGGRFIA